MSGYDDDFARLDNDAARIANDENGDGVRRPKAGDDEELDQDFLHVTFRDMFMRIPEVSKHQANVKRTFSTLSAIEV